MGLLTDPSQFGRLLVLSYHMTSYCPECVVHWWPHQARSDVCPECAGSTSQSLAPLSDDADERYRMALTHERHRRFEAYCAVRDMRRIAA